MIVSAVFVLGMVPIFVATTSGILVFFLRVLQWRKTWPAFTAELPRTRLRMVIVPSAVLLWGAALVLNALASADGTLTFSHFHIHSYCSPYQTEPCPDISFPDWLRLAKQDYGAVWQQARVEYVIRMLPGTSLEGQCYTQSEEACEIVNPVGRGIPVFYKQTLLPLTILAGVLATVTSPAILGSVLEIWNVRGRDQDPLK